MKRSAKYRQQHAAARQKAEAILAAAEARNGELTAEEQAAFDGHRAEMAKLEAAIDREVELERAERLAPAVATVVPKVTGVRHAAEDDHEGRGFTSHRDFLLAVMESADARAVDDVRDERLQSLAVGASERGGDLAYLLPLAFTPAGMRAAVGSDEQSASQDEYGGYSVRETILPGMLQVDPEADPTAGRVQPVPMETPSVKIIARTDKDHATSVSGGLRVLRRAEMAAFTSSRLKIERVQLTAAMLAGLSYETEELLQDSMLSFIAIIEAGFRSEFPHRKLQEKLRGTGGDEYLGILTALAASSLGPTISIAKETGQAADTILAQNVIKMRARCWGYGAAIWLANHDAYPQLATMSLPVGVAGQLVYQQSTVEGRPDMLLGRPIFYTEYASTLGDQGDLILANWSQYLEGVYQPLESASSIHVRFETHERTFKFWERNAGAPWWRVALTPHKGSNTLSPFVTLDARA